MVAAVIAMEEGDMTIVTMIVMVASGMMMIEGEEEEEDMMMIEIDIASVRATMIEIEIVIEIVMMIVAIERRCGKNEGKKRGVYRDQDGESCFSFLPLLSLSAGADGGRWWCVDEKVENDSENELFLSVCVEL